MYLAIKHIHLSCAALSLCLFLLRGYWALYQPVQLQKRWVRVIPHLIDTALLASAAGLAILLQQYPFIDQWLTAKTLALLAYIGFGTVAIKRGKNRRSKAFALLAALFCFAYIVAVALSHNPIPWR